MVHHAAPKRLLTVTRFGVHTAAAAERRAAARKVAASDNQAAARATKEAAPRQPTAAARDWQVYVAKPDDAAEANAAV